MPARLQVPQAAGPFAFEPEPLMCPPQLFSKQDVPQDYAFRSYFGSDPDSFKAGVYKQPQPPGEAMLLPPKPHTGCLPVPDHSCAISLRLGLSSTVHE